MGYSTIAAVAALLPAIIAAQRVHVIDVGGTDLVYSPNAIFAQPGDLVSFNFLKTNHTVVESSFNDPCVPLDNGIFAGFHLGGTGSFTVQINDTKPHWLYCAQAMHCQKGMVAVINPPADPTKTQCTFAQLAAKAPANVPGKKIQGGTFTPNDPAPAACSSNSTSTSASTSTSVSSSTSSALKSQSVTTASAAAASIPVVTTMITYTKTVDCSTSAPVAAASAPPSSKSLSPSSGATIRLAFSNDLEDVTTQQDIPLTGYPVSLNMDLTSISVVSESVPNAVCEVEGQWSAPLGDVTSASPLNVEKDGKATWVASVTCGTENK